MKKLALYGAGSWGLAALAVITGNPSIWARYDEVFFVDDDPSASVPIRARIVGFTGLLREASAHVVEVAVCISDEVARQAVVDRVRDAGLSMSDVSLSFSDDDDIGEEARRVAGTRLH